MTQITDPALIAKLEAARGTTRFAMVEKMAAVDQREINKKKEAAEAQTAQLSLFTPLERRREVIRGVIENDGPGPQHLQFMHSSLAICGLPYRALPDDVLEFERKQGRMGVVVTAGKLRHPNGDRVQQPVPSGPKPRLILAYLSTEAIRQKSPKIDVARSFSAFMEEMGFARRGGERGNIAPFKEQLQALAACSLNISSWDEKRSRSIDAKPFNAFDLWLDNEGDRTIWPETLTFSTDFYETLRERAMPVDSRSLHAFSNSARKIDILFWLNYRLHTMKESRLISWKALAAQFGDGYTRERAFKARFAIDIDHMKAVFPKLPLKLRPEGLQLENADPSVLSIPSAPRKALKKL